MNRQCPCCKTVKESTIENFYISGGKPSSHCKKCISVRNKEKRLLNYEKMRAEEIERARKRKESGITKTREWLDSRNECRKKWLASMSDADLSEFKEKSRKLTLEWAKKNRTKVVVYVKKYTDKKKNDPIFILQSSMRKSISRSISNFGYKKTHRSHEILGCSWDEFKIHMEKQFPRGMSWENRIEWEIDHIVPKHTAKNIEDAIALNRYTNLRPIWKSDNRKKSGKITHLI